MKQVRLVPCIAIGIALSALSSAPLEADSAAAAGYIPPMRDIDPATAEDVVSRAVFGKDDRTDMLSDEYPWSAIGLMWLGSGHCTGTLVGRDLVLTNAHCVHTEEGRMRAPSEIRFYPTHKRGQKGIYSEARQIFTDSLGPDREFFNERQQYSDWALVRLNSPLGDEFGWMSVADTQVTLGGVTLAGYSGDYNDGQTAGVHKGCSINEIREFDVVVHDCDTTAGSSGSALFRVRGSEYQIVALNSAEKGDPVTGMRYEGPVDYSPEVAYNMAVRTEGFLGMVRELRAADTGKDDAYVTVCNYKQQKSGFALAFPMRDDWRTARGVLDPYECVEALVGVRGDQDVYLRDFGLPDAAQSDRSFCVSGNMSPVDNASRACPGNGKNASFKEITAHAGELNLHFLQGGTSEPRAESPAPAGDATVTELCNQWSGEISAAYAWVEADGVVSSGWRNLPPGRCSTVKLPAGYSGDLAVYGETMFGYFGRDVNLCVDAVNAFEIRDAGRSCSGQDRKIVPFSVMRVFPGQRNAWNFR